MTKYEVGVGMFTTKSYAWICPDCGTIETAKDEISTGMPSVRELEHDWDDRKCYCRGYPQQMERIWPKRK